MIRSALPTGPCGSSTPSLHDATNIATPVIEIARSHIASVPGVLVASGDIRSGLAACITDSIGSHWRVWTWLGILRKFRTLPNPPNGGAHRVKCMPPIGGIFRSRCIGEAARSRPQDLTELNNE